MGDTERVLLVSPAGDEREQVRRGLADREFDVRTVAPDQFEEAADATAPCVLVAVPDEQTAEVVARIRAARSEVPVVVLYTAPETARSALVVGATRCLPRPGESAESLAYLATVLERETGAVGESPAEGGNVDRELFRAAVNAVNDLFFVFDLSGSFLLWNDQVNEVTGYTDTEITQMAPTDFFGDDELEKIAAAIQRVIEAGQAKEEATLVTKNGQQLPYEFTGTLLETDGETIGICGVGRDVSQRLEREQALERQTEALRRYDRLNRLIREVNKALVQTDTREAIEETVCETVASAEFVRFAWLGRYGATDDTVEPRAWAGEGAGYLDERPESLAEIDASVTAKTAIKDREVQFVGDVASEATVDPWREAALEYGHRSGVAIPLSYGETVYGCLCVYAPAADAFELLEREVLAELGETVAYAISASEARRALTADTVTKLELRLTDPGLFIVQASQQVSGEVTFDGAIPREDDVVTFLTVRGIDSDTINALAAVSPYDLTVRREGDDGCLVEAVVPDPSLMRLIVDHGGIVRQVVGSEGDCRITIELPTSVDVAEVVGDVREAYECEVLAQRRVNRTEQSGVGVRSDIDATLTERQREVLEAAYMAGYFDWPRDASGDEVAALLDVASPTFHEHVRIAQGKLLASLFEDDADEQ